MSFFQMMASTNDILQGDYPINGDDPLSRRITNMYPAKKKHAFIFDISDTQISLSASKSPM